MGQGECWVSSQGFLEVSESLDDVAAVEVSDPQLVASQGYVVGLGVVFPEVVLVDEAEPSLSLC